MVKTLLRAFLLLFLMLFLSPIKAAETDVYSFELVNRMSAQNDEHYNFLWQALGKQGLQYKLNIKSFKRYKLAYKHNTNSCIFPANKAVVKRLAGKGDKAQLISGNAVDYIGLVALTAEKADLLIRGDLAGKRVAISPILNAKVFLLGIDTKALKVAENNEVLLKMLFRNRADVVIAFMPDILLAAKKLDSPMPHSTDIWFIEKHPVSIVCHDTLSNRAFVQQFNKHLQKLKETGQLREILGPLVNLGDGKDHYF